MAKKGLKLNRSEGKKSSKKSSFFNSKNAIKPDALSKFPGVITKGKK